MWSRLMDLFRSVPMEEIESPVPQPTLQAEEQIPVSSDPAKVDGKSTLMGFDYLKGIRDDEDTNRPRKFINLNKLLRGDYKDE